MNITVTLKNTVGHGRLARCWGLQGPAVPVGGVVLCWAAAPAAAVTLQPWCRVFVCPKGLSGGVVPRRRVHQRELQKLVFILKKNSKIRNTNVIINV